MEGVAINTDSSHELLVRPTDALKTQLRPLIKFLGLHVKQD